MPFLAGAFWTLAKQPYNALANMAVSCSISTPPICRGYVTKVELRQDVAVCTLGDQTRLLLSRFLGSRVAMGDEIVFGVPTEGKGGTEILITKHAVSGRNHCLYQAPIGYVTQPRPDKRNEHFVSAEVLDGALGISKIFLPCKALREYFYGLSHSGDSADRPTLYQILRISPNACAAELRVAFRLRDLELTAAGAPRSQLVALERAPSISLVSQSCALAMTHSVATPRLLPYFPMEGLAPCWLLESPRATAKLSSLAVSSRFPPSSGGGGFVYHCAGAISTMTGHCAAMCVASSSSGSIRPASIPIGIAPGIGGSTCWKPRSRSQVRLCGAVNTASDAGNGIW